MSRPGRATPVKQREFRARSLYLLGFGGFGVLWLVVSVVLAMAAVNGEMGSSVQDRLMTLGVVATLLLLAVWMFQIAASRLVLGDGWIEVPRSPFTFRRGVIRGAEVEWISPVVDMRMPQVVVHLRGGRRWFVLLDPYGDPQEMRQAFIEALGVPEQVHRVRP